MTRGYSLEQDLRFLLNNPKYSDVEILCGDKKILYSCRAILAARSEVFDKLLYNGMKESYEKQISFPKISSAGMEIILEYTYTGLIKEGSLTKDNIIEAYYAADYFQLPDLQNSIMNAVEKNLEKAYNYSPELLSKVVETKPLLEDDFLLNLLTETVATIPLNIIEFGRLSIEALQHLLYYTYEKEKRFATSEYEVFRYCALLAARQVSNDSYKTLMKQLPTLEQIKNLTIIEYKSNIDINNHQKVVKELEPLIKFIDFKLIRGQILAAIIDPLNIIPTEMVLNVYRHKMLLNNTDLDGFRGRPLRFLESDYVWDELACGSKLIIEDDGRVVKAPNGCEMKSVRAKMMFENKDIFEWDVIIEKECISRVGVCASKDFDYEIGGAQRNGWVLASDGYFWSSGDSTSYYCPKFKDVTKITVHLNMNERTCAFTVDGKKYPKVSGLPSKLYPVVSLCHPGRIRIQPHKKI